MGLAVMLKGDLAPKRVRIVARFGGELPWLAGLGCKADGSTSVRGAERDLYLGSAGLSGVDELDS